ncbi:MAG TPA: hypothetical protein VKU39_12105 [Streptosporangiaceae bacterium]|nr:hypothetical protein [Streptosporangiaceae bacterium]
MRSRTGRVLLIPVTGLAFILAACSSSSPASTGTGASSATSAAASSPAAQSSTAQSSTAQSSAPATSGSSEPASGSGAEAAIKANWVAFFSGSTTPSQKIALLQNGQTFAAIVNDPQYQQLSQAATATVHSVTINGTTATVTYDVGIGGSGLGLNGQKGTAVYENGVWKVGDASFCGLITLEHGGQKQGACQSVG